MIDTLLNLIARDLDTFKSGGKYYRICELHEGFGLVLPLDWAEEWVPDLAKDWGHFMYGQTFCEHGFYLRDVCKFLRMKK